MRGTLGLTMATGEAENATPPRLSPAQSKPKIIVELRSRPAQYSPGSGPPLQPVTLMPVHDSTAFIVDRILLPSPGLAKDGKSLPRRMTYIVGWTDLPAARVMVPAMKVLDYVSPWALEEWEYNFELELEEDHARLLQQKELEKIEQEEIARQGTEGEESKKQKGKKRGRPPSHKHTRIQAGAAVFPPDVTGPSPRARTKSGGMSLSTPQKTRLADFEDISEDEGTPSLLVNPAQDGQHNTYTEGGQSRSTGDQTRQSGSPAPKITPVPLPLFLQSGNNLQQQTLPGTFTSIGRGGALSSESSSMSTTPVPVPVLPPLRPSQSMISVPAPKPLTQPWTTHPNGNRIFPSTAAQTPVQPPVVPSSPVSTPGTGSRRTPSEPQQPIVRPQRKRKRQDKPLLDANGMPVWIVKRIEDEALFEVEGQGLQRLYKVRWEGDWPPEENPTWEPAENLPQNLIRNWQKAGSKTKARLSKAQSPKRPKASPEKEKRMKQSVLNWAATQKVPGVSERSHTEVGAGHDPMNVEIEPEATAPGNDKDEDEDELLVVDETLERKNRDEQKPPDLALEERPGFAARISLWEAFLRRG